MKLEAPIQCPNCNKTHTIKFQNIKPGKLFKCSCAANIQFSGDDMSKAQREFDKFEKTLKKLGLN